jgi:hypothetical protein
MGNGMLATGLLIAAVVVAAMGAAASLDQLIKQVPARYRIGVVAYSAYSRAADFHTGIWYSCPCRHPGRDRVGARRDHPRVGALNLGGG